MIKNYIRTAFQNLRRSKVSSFINIFGLASGVALFIIIALFVKNEYSFDRFNEKIDHIYRLERGDWGILGPAYGPDAGEAFPEVKNYVRFNLHQFDNPLLTKDGKSQRLQNVIMADPSVFEVFTFGFIQGDPQTALQEPYSIVLTESLARQVFGKKNPMGQFLLLNQDHQFKVTGVIEDVERFHMEFSAVTPFETLAAMRGAPEMMKRYDNWNYPTFLHLEEGIDVGELESKINNHFEAVYEKVFGEHPGELDFFLRPLGDIYFAKVENELGVKHGNQNFLHAFSAIAIFILVIACINFINLTTAQATRRAKEVGLRKVMGSYRGQLIGQFLSESFLTTLIAFVLSLGLVELLLPYFNTLMQAEVSSHYFSQPFFWMVFVGGILFVGFLAGLYPAFYLSHFSPVSIMKGEKTRGRKGAGFRNALTVFQFFISVVLIIGTLTVYHQIHFMKSMELGFNKEKQVYFRLAGDLGSKKEAFRQALLDHPQVRAVSYAAQAAGQIAWKDQFSYKGNNYHMTFQPADPAYVEVMGLEIEEGANFSWDQPSQLDHAFLINETAARSFSWDQPVGKRVEFYGRMVEIVGVVKDFHYNSLHNKIAPLVIAWDHRGYTANLRIAGADVSAAMDHIQSVWQSFVSNYPFEYHFLDEAFDQHYKADERFGSLIIYFALFAILIACLGLYGLSLFSTQARIKEVGIRKANGAESRHIIRLFLKNFSFNVLIANLIAWPLGYWIMTRWLINFPYRTDIDLWIYALALGISVLIALATVSYQTVKAANTNPALTLRDE